MAAEQSAIPTVEAAAPAGFSFSPGLVKFAKDCTAGTLGGIAVVGVGHPFGENYFLSIKQDQRRFQLVCLRNSLENLSDIFYPTTAALNFYFN
jgi:hypothetical protein